MINISPVLSIFPQNVLKTGEMLIIWGLPAPQKRGVLLIRCLMIDWERHRQRQRRRRRQRRRQRTRERERERQTETDRDRQRQRQIEEKRGHMGMEWGTDMKKEHNNRGIERERERQRKTKNWDIETMREITQKRQRDWERERQKSVKYTITRTLMEAKKQQALTSQTSG